MRPLIRLPALIFAVAAIAAMAQAPELAVKDAWARMPLVPQNNSGVYMRLENNGAVARSVVSVSTLDAARAELHETQMERGMMKMSPAKELTVPAKGSVELAPGGYHIMLFAVKKAVKPGDSLQIVLHLKDGSSVPVAARVRAGDEGSGAASSGMSGMRGMH